MAKIYMELRSGVGNQLFQFAFGYALAAEFNKELILCPAYFDPRWKYWVKKILGREARSFRLPLILKDHDGIQIQTSFENPLKINSSIRVLDELKQEIDLIKSACNEDQDVYLKGYWQNPTLFQHCTDRLAAMLGLKFTVSEKYKTTLQQVDPTLVGIHVRRGDFLTNRAFGACTLQYYKTAIQAIQKVVTNPKFLVFTNDRKWVETNFPTNISYQIYSNILNNNTDLEEIFLMTKLRSMIIPNSTFSWWGAYLNPIREKNIVCPTHWFLNKKLQQNSSNLPLPGWITLANELELSK